mgnify:CR=1 FL=1
MTQLGEGVNPSVIAPGGDEKCVFCQEDHQDEEDAGTHTFGRDMGKLKGEGRSYTKGSARVTRYPDPGMPPLAEWSRDITKTGGYKAAAHHCVALKTASEHALSGELNAAGYDPNRGSNCIWLPYSRGQFVRARAYNKGLQKHRGGHTDAYFDKVRDHLDLLQSQIERKFCTQNKKPGKDWVLEFMLAQENDIWSGVANPRAQAYRLYNDSYLNPAARWGTFKPEEVGKDGKALRKPEYLKDEPDDGSAEAESADDPE